MANKEFKNIEEFIEGFTRNGPTPNEFIYDGTIWGLDFMYKGIIYRITRDTIGNEEELRKKLNAPADTYIQFYIIPNEQYPCENVENLDLFIGLYSNVEDLLDNGKINGRMLRDIIANEETEILAID